MKLEGNTGKEKEMKEKRTEKKVSKLTEDMHKKVRFQVRKKRTQETIQRSQSQRRQPRMFIGNNGILEKAMGQQALGYIKVGDKMTRLTDFIITGNKLSTCLVLTANTERAKDKLKEIEFQGWQHLLPDSVLFEPRYMNHFVGDLIDQGYTVGTLTEVDNQKEN